MDIMTYFQRENQHALYSGAEMSAIDGQFCDFLKGSGSTSKAGVLPASLSPPSPSQRVKGDGRLRRSRQKAWDRLIKKLHKCVSVGYTARMKDVGLRIRIDRELREQFLAACQKEDKPAAQVIREFMRSYVAQHTVDVADTLVFGNEKKNRKIR